MAEIKYIERHNEVSEGDFLIRIEESDEVKNILVPKENGKSSAVDTLAWLARNEIRDWDTKVTYSLLEYLSPLKQRVLRTVKIN